jgi:F0F1-type ATP synthase epsilon subunit
MKLIITRTDSTQEYVVSRIHAVTQIGEYVILPDHAPLLLALEPESVLTYVLHDSAAQPQTCEIRTAGLLLIDRSVVQLITA